MTDEKNITLHLNNIHVERICFNKIFTAPRRWLVLLIELLFFLERRSTHV